MRAADAESDTWRSAESIQRAEADDSAELARAARQGNRAALAQLHRKFAPLVHGVLLARVPYHDANDLTQDVFMQAMQKLHTLHDPRTVGPWLMTLARRAAADHFRRRKAHVELTDTQPASSADSHDRNTRDRAHAALDAIRSLPEAYQETLILRLVEGLTGPQIAARTGLSQGSVRVNLHRGMKMLRNALGIEETRP
jgi:RNA polymerase sigma-70 factor (ECF subfamily)